MPVFSSPFSPNHRKFSESLTAVFLPSPAIIEIFSTHFARLSGTFFIYYSNCELNWIYLLIGTFSLLPMSPSFFFFFLLVYILIVMKFSNFTVHLTFIHCDFWWKVSLVDIIYSGREKKDCLMRNYDIKTITQLLNQSQRLCNYVCWMFKWN